MAKMWNGDEATLGNYRKMAACLFGEDSHSVEYLDHKIHFATSGKYEIVCVDECTMVYLLIQIHKGSHLFEDRDT